MTEEGPPPGLVSLTPIGDGMLLLTIRKESYRILQAGKTATLPPVGYASIFSKSGRKRKPIRHVEYPLGNVMCAIADGSWTEPTDLIILRHDDWVDLKNMAHNAFRKNTFKVVAKQEDHK